MPDAAGTEPADRAAAGTVVVTDDPPGRRYVATVDGQVAGYLRYSQTGQDDDRDPARDRGRVLALVTRVDDEFAGRGVGSALARRLLDDALLRGDTVAARCPFVAAYAARHPEYADAIAPGRPGDD